MEDMATGTKSEEKICDRSNASAEKSLRIDQNGFFAMAFCLRKQEVFLVSRIAYSNDGPATQVDVILNNDILGSFRTHTGSNFGHLWNEFHLTGAIGMPFILEPGGYNFTLSVEVGGAVEIDFIEFAFSLSSNKEEVLCTDQALPPRVIENNNDGQQFTDEQTPQ
ncbi:hypothetical protein LOTGIDRAFT_154712 [Lottia gigantea]|uniref:Uncharacterized protein n=1 Tax=Lottia gigantea TaxID=225164 RepID=V4BEC7_LOTGI|nr:hypothetical protein LOTGIDRAFT_154712 [Lottia gigantea]ESO87209.1 hypothetical protein LOTGIDRAFT_154712 [Lottia gigantea]